MPLQAGYDILLHTAPCEAGCHDVYVGIYREQDGTEDVDASQIEGCWWNEYIYGNIVDKKKREAVDMIPDFMQ